VEFTALPSRICRAKALLKLLVLRGSATRFLKVGEKYYILFVNNLLLFKTVKEFSKSVNI